MENKTKGAGDDYPVIPLAQKTFRVRITKASSSQSWYKNKVGQEFDVYVNPDGDKTAFILERDRLASITQRFISSFDCEPVEQINKYVEMEKELASLKEVVKELIPIAEENQRHHEVYATVFPKFSPISEAYKSTIERAKTLLR